MEKDLFRFSHYPDFQHPTFLLAGWGEELRSLEGRVVNFLLRQLEGKEFCRIEPSEFFPLDGIQIHRDVVQIPQSRFFLCKKSLVIFTSVLPQFEWYRFLNAVLDVAQNYCKVDEIYTLGAILSLSTHTTPRELVGVFGSIDFKRRMSEYGFIRDIDYQSPPAQKPTPSSFLLWAAKQRGLPGVSLWVTVPFYLVGVGDPMAVKRILEFFERRFRLGLDFVDIEEEAREQSAKIARLRASSAKINDSIRKLENNLPLTDEEALLLSNGIEEALGK